MSRAELDFAIEWAALEGWNPGLYDAGCFYATDPSGYFIGFLDSKPIACISAVAYDEKFGFVGFYITKPVFRGKGYGIQMWNRAMAYLETQNVGLDGVIAQQENYKKSGFKFAYSNIRYQSIVKHTKTEGSGLAELAKVPFEKLVTYDHRFFPTSRPKFLKYWIGMPESVGLASLKNGTMEGYGLIRKCRKGYKVGPLFADNLETATSLYQGLCNRVHEEEDVFLDVPEVNQPAVSFAETSGMKKVFGTARMYTRQEPDIDLKGVFGVTTFELG